jgi:hypothetical protein
MAALCSKGSRKKFEATCYNHKKTIVMQSSFWLCSFFSLLFIFKLFSLFSKFKRRNKVRLASETMDVWQEEEGDWLLANIHIWNFLFFFQKTDFSFVYFFVCKKAICFWHLISFQFFFSILFLSSQEDTFNSSVMQIKKQPKNRTCKKLNKNLGIYTSQVFVLFLLIPTDTQTTMVVETKKRSFFFFFFPLLLNIIDRL